MRKFFVLTLALALMLTACSAGSSASATLEINGPMPAEAETVQPSVQAQTPVQTAAPVQTEQPSAAVEATVAVTVEVPQAAAAPAGETVVYKIVPGESRAEYQVGETFFSQNNRFNLAVGVTSAINGEITLDMSNPQNAKLGVITVDISQLKSDSNRRDDRIRQSWLESAAYPTATFTPTKIEGLPAAYNMGDEITFTVTGDLTVRQVTKPVTFQVKAKLLDNQLTGTAETTISLNEFGVGPIEIAGMLKTEDSAKLVLNFVARP